MKKLLGCLLVLVMVLTLSQNVFAAYADTVKPYYNNATSAKVYLDIDASGTANTSIFCQGKAGVKRIYVATCLERKVNGAWERVDIPSPNDVWSYSTTSTTGMANYSASLPGRGEYRAVATFTVTAATMETFTEIAYATY